jgi:putative transposase
MPWQQVSTVDQRLQFVADYQRQVFTMTELCARYGISRQAGYETIARYGRCGAAGLASQSRRPHHSPDATPDEVVHWIVALRRRHPSYGPKKLLAMLKRQHHRAAWPATSTVALILKRQGLITEAPRKRRHGATPVAPLVRPAAPNELWTVDFKGQFRTGDGRYCYPLTVADRFSRFLLDCHGLLRPTELETRQRFTHAFAEYGLPGAIRSDNGVPFASTGLARLSTLSVWWLRLSIRLDRSRPGHPEENGAHEYMHRVLKRETTRPPAATCAQQQPHFDVFRKRYNEERPHEALGQVAPATLYAASSRPLPARLPPVEYPGHFEKRRVSTAGCFSWHSQTLFLTRALADQYVGLEEVDDGIWTVYFCQQPIARFDVRANTISETGERNGATS